MYKNQPIVSLFFVIFLILFSTPYAWGFGLDQHVEITRNALWFLRPYFLNQIVDANKEVDYPTIDIAGEHFDACSWDDASDNLQTLYRGFTPYLFPTGLSSLRQFGTMLHPIQDFYSHSNWVELGLGGRLLVEHQGPWPDLIKWTNVSPYPNNQVFLAQDDEPWSMGGGLTPELRRQGILVGHALITDSRPAWQAGDDCPDNVEDIEHPQINKDGPTNNAYAGSHSEYPRLHELAKDTAEKATYNEFCRLLNYAHSKPLYVGADPYASNSYLLALLLDKDQTFYGCQFPQEPKNVKMKAEVVSIKMVDAHSHRGPANWNLVFALYNGKFETITKQTETVAIESNKIWPPNKLPSPIVTCVNEKPSLDNPIVLTVQGWKDEDDPNGKGIMTKDDYETLDYAPTVYRPTVSSDSWPQTGFGTPVSINDDVRVTFKVSFIPTLPGACSAGGTGTVGDTDGGVVDGDTDDEVVDGGIGTGGVGPVD